MVRALCCLSYNEIQEDNLLGKPCPGRGKFSLLDIKYKLIDLCLLNMILASREMEGTNHQNKNVRQDKM